MLVPFISLRLDPMSSNHQTSFPLVIPSACRSYLIQSQDHEVPWRMTWQGIQNEKQKVEMESASATLTRCTYRTPWKTYDGLDGSEMES